MQGTRPLEVIILVKFQFFSVLGAVNPTPGPIKVKFGREEQTYGLYGFCRAKTPKNPKIDFE